MTVQERREGGVRGHGESGTGSATLRFPGLLARALSGVKPNWNWCENGGFGDSRFLRVHEARGMWKDLVTRKALCGCQDNS